MGSLMPGPYIRVDGELYASKERADKARKYGTEEYPPLGPDWIEDRLQDGEGEDHFEEPEGYPDYSPGDFFDFSSGGQLPSGERKKVEKKRDVQSTSTSTGTRRTGQSPQRTRRSSGRTQSSSTAVGGLPRLSDLTEAGSEFVSGYPRRVKRALSGDSPRQAQVEVAAETALYGGVLYGAWKLTKAAAYVGGAYFAYQWLLADPPEVPVTMQ